MKLLAIGIAAFLLADVGGALVWLDWHFEEPGAGHAPSLVRHLQARSVLTVFAHPDDEQAVAGLLVDAAGQDGGVARMIAAAQGQASSSAVLAFEQFVRASSPVCLKQPAAHCVDAGWGFADRNRDSRLSLAELRAVRNAVQDWMGWRGKTLSAQERLAILLGLWIVDAVGLETLMARFDADGDGFVDRAELLADVRLDERPLGQVLLDAKAVDRKAVARRLGSLGPVFEGFFR